MLSPSVSCMFTVSIKGQWSDNKMKKCQKARVQPPENCMSVVTNNRSKSQGMFSSSVISSEDFTVLEKIPNSQSFLHVEVCCLGETQGVSSIREQENVEGPTGLHTGTFIFFT